MPVRNLDALDICYHFTQRYDHIGTTFKDCWGTDEFTLIVNTVFHGIAMYNFFDDFTRLTTHLGLSIQVH